MLPLWPRDHSCQGQCDYHNSTPSVDDGKNDKDETSFNNVATEDECCRRRRLMPKRKRGVEEGDEKQGEEKQDCLGVVCENIGNVMKKNKGGPLAHWRSSP